jgi:hypothetical protein
MQCLHKRAQKNYFYLYFVKYALKNQMLPVKVSLLNEMCYFKSYIFKEVLSWKKIDNKFGIMYWTNLIKYIYIFLDYTHSFYADGQRRHTVSIHSKISRLGFPQEASQQK